MLNTSHDASRHDGKARADFDVWAGIKGQRLRKGRDVVAAMPQVCVDIRESHMGDDRQRPPQ